MGISNSKAEVIWETTLIPELEFLCDIKFSGDVANQEDIYKFINNNLEAIKTEQSMYDKVKQQVDSETFKHIVKIVDSEEKARFIMDKGDDYIEGFFMGLDFDTPLFDF